MGSLLIWTFFAVELGAQQPVIVRTTAAGKLRVAKLTPGAKVPLKVVSSVGPCGESVAKDSRIELTVDRVEKERGAAWYKQLGAFTGVLRDAAPARRRVIARSASLQSPGQAAAAIEVNVAEVYRPKKAAAKGQKSESGRDTVVVLEAKGLPGGGTREAAGPVAVAAGTQASVLLLSGLTASQAKDGTGFQAMVTEPVVVGGKVAIPAGAVIEGKVTRGVPPRRLRRPAALSLHFHKLNQGTGVEVAGALSGAEAEGPAVTIDREGRITSRRPIHRMLIDTAIAYVAGKVVDDLIEEGAKAIWTATAAGTAETAARYVGLGVGVGFFLAQRGPDVRVPRYAPMNVTFTRPFVADAGMGCAAGSR